MKHYLKYFATFWQSISEMSQKIIKNINELIKYNLIVGFYVKVKSNQLDFQVW
jgi:hypothetical protein